MNGNEEIELEKGTITVFKEYQFIVLIYETGKEDFKSYGFHYRTEDEKEEQIEFFEKFLEQLED